MKCIGIHSFISGLVQGVWFRASTKEQADRLGITGWVQNCQDGRVEVMAYGDEDKVLELQRWLAHGPSGATVETVTETEVPYENVQQFEVRREQHG